MFRIKKQNKCLHKKSAVKPDTALTSPLSSDIPASKVIICLINSLIYRRVSGNTDLLTLLHRRRRRHMRALDP